MTDLDLMGLNLEDRQEIARIGFRAWLERVCLEQQTRLAQKSRTENEQKEKKPWHKSENPQKS